MWLVFLVMLFSVNMQSQMTIGGKKVPEPFSALEVLNIGGVRLPQMTTAQRNVFAVRDNVKGEGLTIYNIDTKCVEYWNKVRWVSMCDDVTSGLIAMADNGLTAAAGKVQLGGALLKPTALVTTSAYTLAIQGLQAGTTTDKILVADANGILKWIDRATLGGDNLGNHIATTTLNMNGNNIDNAASITATGKTTTGTAQIAKGTNGLSPQPGYIATAADVSGNIIWSIPGQQQGSVAGVWDFMGTTTTTVTTGNTVSLPMNGNTITLLKDAYVLITFAAIPCLATLSSKTEPAVAQGSFDLMVDSAKVTSSYWSITQISTSSTLNWAYTGNYTTAQKLVQLSAGTHTIGLNVKVWIGGSSSGTRNVTISMNQDGSLFEGGLSTDREALKSRISVIAFNK